MNVVELQAQLIEYAKSIGIDKIGFTTAAPFDSLKNILKRQQELGYESGFEERNVDLRSDPIQLLPEAESIISIAVAYPSKMENAPLGKKGERRGIFCRSSWGIDYHTALRERLKKLEVWLMELVPDVKFKSMVDTGELVDRAVAERAGIGWVGKVVCFNHPVKVFFDDAFSVRCCGSDGAERGCAGPLHSGVSVCFVVVTDI